MAFVSVHMHVHACTQRHACMIRILGTVLGRSGHMKNWGGIDIRELSRVILPEVKAPPVLGEVFQKMRTKCKA